MGSGSNVLYIADGVHPNEQGARIIAENVATALQAGWGS